MLPPQFTVASRQTASSGTKIPQRDYGRTRHSLLGPPYSEFPLGVQLTKCISARDTVVLHQPTTLYALSSRLLLLGHSLYLLNYAGILALFLSFVNRVFEYFFE